MKPIPAPTKYNQQEREELMRLKSLYAVKLTAEERQEQLQQSLRNVVNYLQSVAKGK
jgi:transcriptional antiterminator